MLYSSHEGFLRGTVPFIQSGLDCEDAVMVLTDSWNIKLLRNELGARARQVLFEDIRVVGRNPGRIISIWQEFSADRFAEGRSIRGIGEPVWDGRDAASLEECQVHEALLNTAFSSGRAWPLLCPYNIGTLGDSWERNASLTHRFIGYDGPRLKESSVYDESASNPLRLPDFPEPSGPIETRSFGLKDLKGIREWISEVSLEAGISPDRSSDFVTAVNEIASNSIKYGGGGGRIRMWSDGGQLVCEVADDGVIADPMVGRIKPIVGEHHGRGVWLAHQLCDLIQIRSNPDLGTVVRLHMDVPTVPGSQSR